MSDTTTETAAQDPEVGRLADEPDTTAETAKPDEGIAQPVTAAQPTTQTAAQSGGETDGTGFGAGGYTPAFNPTVRTVVYVAGLVASIVSAGFIAFGNPDVGAFIGSAAALVASALGTAYNPLSVARRSQLAALPDPAQPKHAA
jgi:hypothetical protein